jgi:hypothetical protein
MTNKLFNSAKKTLLTMTAILTVFAGLALADNINLDMEGSTATIPKGNTVERKIFGVPSGIPGDLKIKLKWHAVNIIPNTFNQLKVQVLHGSDVLKTTNCYSIHSNKSPECNFTIAVSEAEANQSGSWKLKVTNNSNDEVIGFNLEKGGDVNPMVPNFRSVYTPDCPNTVNLDMEGTTLTLGKGNTQERRLFGIGSANGDLVLKMKWHAVNIIPNTFNALKVEVINGSDVVQSKTCYSVHSNKTPKCEFSFQTGDRPANQWKLRITNNSNDEVIGFNIAKESGELNPLVPSFKSTYKAKCP